MPLPVRQVLLLLLGIGALPGALELARPFTDHAVLQADRALPVWGRTVAGADVEVWIGERRERATASAEGDWQVEFPAARASGAPLRMVVRSGGEELAREDVVFGEVWLASGQSNMRWMLKDCEEGGEAVANSADEGEGLRLLNFKGQLHPGGGKFSRERLVDLRPDNYYESSGWSRASPESSEEFSGVGYFFGQKLREQLKVPVGVIHLAVGGTPMEAHLPRWAFQRDEVLRPLLEDWWINPAYPQWCRQRAALNLTEWLADPPPGRSPPHPFAPAFLWEAGLAPLLPFPVRGVIWYQGESNATVDGGQGAAESRELNERKFRALVGAWRRAWGREDLPVYFVQLPGLNRNWAPFRQMQLKVARETPHCEMAVSLDLGHPTNVHPRRKRPVGERLARLALEGTYSRELVGSGPMVRAWEAPGRAGEPLVVRFRHAVGLRLSVRGELAGFEVAGANRVYHPARAEIEGDGISLWSAEVPQPLFARYAWANDPKATLWNGAGLPGSPFSTESLKSEVK